MKRITVFGGNGYVGQSILKSLLPFQVKNPELKLLSVNRSGKPKDGVLTSSSTIDWIKGDIFDPITYSDELKESGCVISCVGAFGSNEWMEKINGDANILLVDEAIKAGVKKFIYLSTVENTLPDFVLNGYFNGKRRAEESVLKAYPESGVVLKPGFMYGTRFVPTSSTSSISIPLWILGKPLEFFLSLPGADRLKYIPGLRAPLTRPLSVDLVGKVAAHLAFSSIQQQQQQAEQEQSSGSGNDEKKTSRSTSDLRTVGIFNVDDMTHYSEQLKKI